MSKTNLMKESARLLPRVNENRRDSALHLQREREGHLILLPIPPLRCAAWIDELTGDPTPECSGLVNREPVSLFPRSKVEGSLTTKVNPPGPLLLKPMHLLQDGPWRN